MRPATMKMCPALFRVAALGTFVALFATPTAHACQPPLAGILARSMWPPAGSVGVPINTGVVVAYDSGTLQTDSLFPAENLALRVKGETQMTAAKVSVLGQDLFLLRPEQDLRPLTEYEIVDDWGKIPCSSWEDGSDALSARCGTGQPIAWGTFVTGQQRDTTAPAFSGLAQITIAKVEGFDGCYNGYEGKGVSLRLQWASTIASAADAGHYFRVRLDEQIIGHGIDNDAWVAFACDGQEWKSQLRNGGGGTMRTPIAGGPGRYRVTAIDWAGNEDENQIVIPIDGSCTEILEGLEDNGATVVTPAPAPTPASGCSIGTSRNAEGGGPPVLIAILLSAIFTSRRAHARTD